MTHQKATSLFLLPFLFLFLALALSLNAQAQDNNNHGTIKVRKDIPVEDFTDIDFVPYYKYADFDELLQQNIKYPKDAFQKKIEGKVKVLVIIDDSGIIVWKEVIQSVYPSIDKEALRVLTGLKEFERIEKDGAPINVRTTIEIPFKM